MHFQKNHKLEGLHGHVSSLLVERCSVTPPLFSDAMFFKQFLEKT